MTYNWNTGVITAKASEPIQSRASDYRNPGDNSSPAGEQIVAGIGTSSYDGKVVWWDGFDPTKEKSTTSFVMMFKDCLFADSFSLVKMFADEQLIISTVAPLRQSGQTIRFYDGTQTAVDPLLTRALGAANATAWPGYVYAVFENFDCSNYGNRIPLIRVVLAGSVTDAAASEDQSTLSFGAYGIGYSNGAFAVDPVKGHHYQIVSDGNNDAYVSTVDISTLTEINRVPIFGISPFGVINFTVALLGTDYIACSVSEPGVRPALLNVQTGELVASLAMVTGGGTDWELSPKRAIPLPSWNATKFIVVTERGEVYDAYTTLSQVGVFVADVTNKTLTWIVHPYTNPMLGADEGAVTTSVEFGPIVDGVVSMWYTDGHATDEGAVNVALISDAGFTSGAFYVETVAGKKPKGLAYDQTKSVLVVYREDGSFLKLNAVTGALISTTAGAVTTYNINIWGDDPPVHEYQAFITNSRPGYTLATRGDLDGDIYLIDLDTFATTLLIDQSDFNDHDSSKFFDQYYGWMTEGSDDAGIINRVTLGDATPDTVDLVDIFGQLATFDDRFDIGDLDFTGFSGNECSGLKLDNDTTIDNLENSIAELFDVKIVESDGTRKYTFPPRDGSFAIDLTLDPEDIVERGSTTIEKTFGAGEDEFVGCSVSYFDVDADYKRLEQTYLRPIGIYDVTRSKKKRTINTVLSLTANQSKQLATLAVYRSVMGNEFYNFGLVPGFSHAEPADILSFDFRGFTTIARIKEATLNADYTQDIVAYQYLRFADATYTGASLPTVEEDAQSIFTRLIYLDIPLLSASHDLDGDGLVQYAQMAGYGTLLVNGTLYKSPDGNTFTSQGSTFGAVPVVGTISAISGTPTDPFVQDTTNEIAVVISGGDIADLVTITTPEFEAGTNVAAIGRNGRWVLIWFQTVSSSNGVATLSDLMWGVRGSEVWIEDLAVGDEFVLINPAYYTRFRNDVEDLDDSFYYKAANPLVPLGSVATAAYVASGVAETPYAAINLDAVIDGSDIDLTWDYRSRVATGTNPTDYGEETLSFQIDIMDGDTVLRTLTSTTNAKTYLSADITTDFGGMPASIKFRVYMMSALPILVPGQTPAVEGRGYMAEATIYIGAPGIPMGLLLTLTYS
jgi:hypothetical protein